MVFLEEIMLENFKSFNGEHKVGPLMPFTAIAGPNGSGKSNFTDAIGFVMAVNFRNLRVTKINELVHRSISGHAQPGMSVKAVLRANNGTEVLFQRTLKGSSCQHRINNFVVPYKTYVEGLRELHIDPSIKDFVVFQDSVELFLTKSPKERTTMFEEMSGSGMLALKYKRLSMSISQHKEEFEYLIAFKRKLTTKIKRMQVAKENAKEYEALEKRHTAEQIRLTLFDLHCLERELESSVADEEHTLRYIDEITRKKVELEEKLATTIHRCKEEKNEMAAIERQVTEMECRGVKVTSEVRKFQTLIEHGQSRVNSCRESYNSALNADEARSRTITKLKEALIEVEKKKYDYCLRFAETLGRNFELNDSQIEKYESLTDLFLMTPLDDSMILLSLERKYNSLDDVFFSKNSEKNETKYATERQNELRFVTMERYNKLAQRRDATQRELDVLSRYVRDLNLKLGALKKQEQNLKKQIEEIGEVDCDNVEVRKMRKKINVVENLKELFPGVYDRLENMCKPVNRRYDLAVKKVLGPHMNSIVVDTLDTVVECGGYLKQQALGNETFLPLDILNVEPLKEHLRNIEDPPNVKLLYDVIVFSPEAISKAVLYATGSTLVTETAEDAIKIVFNADEEKQYDCVSRQDGIYYQRSGLISGGTLDHAKRAQSCSTEEQAKLQIRKEQLTSKLKEIQENMPTEGELFDTHLNMKTLEARIKYLNDDCDTVRGEVIAHEMKLQDLESISDVANYQCSIAQEALQAVSKEIDAVKLNIEEERKKIFVEFCEDIGVTDIHQYENGQEEYQNALRNFDNQIDRIRRELEVEMDCDTTRKVELWKKSLHEAEAQLRLALEGKETHSNGAEYQQMLKTIQVIEPMYENLKGSVTAKRNEIMQLRDQLRDIGGKHQASMKQLQKMKLSVQRLKQRRQAIIIEAKVNGFKIPTVNDSTRRSSQIERSDSSDENLSTIEESPGIEFEFARLPKGLLRLEASEAIQARKELATKVAETSSAMEKIEDPNMKASQQLKSSKKERVEIDIKIRNSSKMLHNVIADFEEVKAKRYAKFMEVFEHVQDRVNIIYKNLTGSESAQAYLVPENSEEPYLGRIYYDCIVPRKRLRRTEDLSGGEKVLASLALVFAVQSRLSPPFQMLDEVDAPLDNINVDRVIQYVKTGKEVQQSIVVSHKPELGIAADLVIAIVPILTASGTESKIFTLNLQRYRKR